MLAPANRRRPMPASGMRCFPSWSPMHQPQPNGIAIAHLRLMVSAGWRGVRQAGEGPVVDGFGSLEKVADGRVAIALRGPSDVAEWSLCCQVQSAPRSARRIPTARSSRSAPATDHLAPPFPQAPNVAARRAARRRWRVRQRACRSACRCGALRGDANAGRSGAGRGARDGELTRSRWTRGQPHLAHRLRTKD